MITNATALQAMNRSPNAHYVLGNDIDASGTAAWNAGRGFEPIGDYEDRFNGTFDGRNYTIRGLTIDRPSGRFVGLFGASDGTIENVRLVDVDVTGDYMVGGLLGELTKGQGTIQHAYVSGTVQGDGPVGGVVGYLSANSVVRQVGANVDVSASVGAGGITGGIRARSGSVTESYAIATLDAAKTGGIIEGIDRGSVTTVYTRGEATSPPENGGITNVVRGTLVEGYSTVEIPPADEGRGYGPIAGHGPDADDVRDFYWSPETAGIDESAVAGATQLSHSAMRGSAARTAMSGLDFGDEWTATDGYPILAWQVEDVTLALDDSSVMVGEATQATVTLELFSGRTVTASTTAELASNTSALSIAGTELQASDRGTARITASVAGHSDTATVSMLAPPDIDYQSGSLDSELIARGTPVTINATYANSGDLRGDHTAVLSAGGERVETESVSVSGRSETSIDVQWEPTETGTYDLTLDGAAVGTIEVVEPPEIEAVAASTSTSAVLAGRETNVSVTLENPDRIAGEHTAALAAGGREVIERSVRVDAESQSTLALGWTPDTPGTYNLSVGNVSAGTLTVVDRGAITVSDVQAPTKATAGDDVTVTATISSEADTAVDVPVTYRSDGVGSKRTAVTVEPGTTNVSFERSVTSAGRVVHRVGAGADRAAEETAVRAPATLEVTNLAGSETATTGSEMTVTATIENTGGVATEESVTVALDGATITTEPVSLASGEATRVSASFTLAAGGEHTYTVETEDDSVSATVVAESGEATDSTASADGESDTTAPSDDEPTTTSGDGPGFGIAVTLFALLALGAGARRDS